MRDRKMFPGNPFPAAGQALPPPPPAPGFNVGPNGMPMRPMMRDEATRPLAPADARMFLGRAYDPAKTYRRDRRSGHVEPVDEPTAPASPAPSRRDGGHAGFNAADWELLRRLARAYAEQDGQAPSSPAPAAAAPDGAAKI
jgi:hypothetical protein